MMVRTYKPTEQCAICGGRCCKRMGCHYSPTDFKDLSYNGLKSEIEKGRISIDWWENSSGSEYFLRARHVGAPIVDPSWGGVCINLTSTGCSLSWEERPLGGRSLKPGKRGCTGDYSKEDCKNEWKQYSEVLEQLVEYFSDSGVGSDPLDELLQMFERFKV